MPAKPEMTVKFAELQPVDRLSFQIVGLPGYLGKEGVVEDGEKALVAAAAAGQGQGRKGNAGAQLDCNASDSSTNDSSTIDSGASWVHCCAQIARRDAGLASIAGVLIALRVEARLRVDANVALRNLASAGLLIALRVDASVLIAFRLASIAGVLIALRLASIAGVLIIAGVLLIA